MAEDSILFKEEFRNVINGIKSFIPVKRKSFKAINARWIYRIENTDFYLVYLTRERLKTVSVYNHKNGKYETSEPYGWLWYQIKIKNDEVKNIKRIDMYEIMDNPELPVEILFMLTDLEKLKSTSKPY